MDKKTLLKQLLIQAIETKRPDKIKEFCSPVWNQPFFFQIDKAKAITISYAPTDKGVKTNYSNLYEMYKKDNHCFSSEDIYNLLYNFKKEFYWRKNFDKIFSAVGIHESEIAHLDMSCFPYIEDSYRQYFMNNGTDSTYKFTLEAIKLINNQLEYILVDGKDNHEIILKYLLQDYNFIKKTKIKANKSRSCEIYIYKHKLYKTMLIYSNMFLYGMTCISNFCIGQIIDFISDKTNNTSPALEPTDLNKTNTPPTQKSTKIGEYFTIKNQKETCKNKIGFLALNSENENVGIVFMSDDKRTPAYEHCELAFFNKYKGKEWYRFTSNGCRIRWADLCNKLAISGEIKIFID